ncbi:MAG: FAD-dependent oxidoreductase [Pirellulales bacterium]
MAPKRVLIVGGSGGGASCAARLRRLDERAEIFVFERGPYVSFANCGLPYYVGGVIEDRRKLLVATPERFRDWFRVEIRTRREAKRIDRALKTIEVVNTETGKTTIHPYDTLVLAPGAEPLRPELPGIDLPGIFTVRNIPDADAIHAWIAARGAVRAVVVGGGFIGLEMAENLVRRGSDVTLVEMRNQVLPTMDPEMVAPVEGELRAHGVHLRLGTKVTAFESGGESALAVLTEKGERLTADLVILAIGVRPEVDLAREAGLEIGQRGGIRVDEQMRTADSAIWAVGDAVEVRDAVTGQWTLAPLAGPANRQGRVAADAICGRPSKFRGVQGTLAVGVFDLTFASTGSGEAALRRAGMAYEKIYTHSANHATYYPGAEMIASKLLFDPQTGRVLGAQAVGKAGVEKRIDVLAMAIQMGATAFDLEEAELCYAPQYGSSRDPVNTLGFVAANVLRGDVAVAHWTDLAQLRQTAAPARQPLVVDVRSVPEFEQNRVEGTVNIPLGELRQRLGELPHDREIWVHCGVGQRSYYATRILAQHGFRVRNLTGGIKTYGTVRSKE